MRMRKVVFLLGCGMGVIVSISLIAGCATWPGGAKRGEGGELYKPLEVAPTLRFDDIPVPARFKAVPERSFTFQNDHTRVGLLRYAGRIHGDQVVAFYKEQMPLYGWNLLNVVEYGVRTLNFEKGDESCVVSVEASRTKTNLTIAISSVSRKAKAGGK